MNWKRGLTRIYVVLWIVFAAIGALLSAQATTKGMESRRHISDFLRKHRNLSLTDLQTLPLDTLQVRLAPRLVEVDGFLVKFPADVPADSMIKVLNAYSADSLRAALAGGKPLGREKYPSLREQGSSGIQAVLFRSGDVKEDELTSVQADAMSDTVTRPAASLLEVWGLWVAAYLAAPPVVLMTLRWVASGFSS